MTAFAHFAAALLDNGYSPVPDLPASRKPPMKGWDRLRERSAPVDPNAPPVSDRRILDFCRAVLTGLRGLTKGRNVGLYRASCVLDAKLFVASGRASQRAESRGGCQERGGSALPATPEVV